MNKYKIGLVCMIALSTLAMNTSDVNASDNNRINSSQVRSGEFDPTTSEYYNALVSNEEFQAKWEAASEKGDTRGQSGGGAEWYVDGDDLHIGEINFNTTNNSATIINQSLVENKNIYIDKVNDLNNRLFQGLKFKGLYGLNNLKSETLTSAERLFASSDFETDFSLLDTSNVTNMSNMFRGFGNHLDLKSIDLSTFNVESVEDMSSMFEGTSLSSIGDTNNWNPKNVTNMSHMFDHSKMKDIGVSNWDVGKVEDFNYFLYNPQTDFIDVSKWNTSSAKNMGYMFSNINNPKLNKIDVSKWDTSSVENMESMFSYVMNNIEVDVSGWNTSAVKNMSSMYRYSRIDNIDVSDWNVSSVINFNYTFDRSVATDLDVSEWNVSSSETMRGMFDRSKAKELEVSNWDVSKVEDMQAAFAGVNLNELDVSEWETLSVKDSSRMFKGANIKTIDVSEWQTSTFEDISEMFSSATTERIDLSKWDTSKITNAEGIVSSSKTNYIDLSNFNFNYYGSAYLFGKNRGVGQDTTGSLKSYDERGLSLIIPNFEMIGYSQFQGTSFLGGEMSYIDFSNAKFSTIPDSFIFSVSHKVGKYSIKTMTINDSIYQPDRESSPFDLDKFPKNWRLASDHSITATSDELHTSTVVRDHPGLWEVYTPNHLSLSTNTPNIAFSDVKLGSSMTNPIKLNLDYESADGVVLSQKANRDDNQFSLNRENDSYILSSISKEVYTSTSNKAVEELEYELEFNPTKIGAADNSITWTLSYKI